MRNLVYQAAEALKARFRKIFSVNPDWSSSVASASQFRPTAPGSSSFYKPVEIDRFDPARFHYFDRDSRRNPPPLITVLNPTAYQAISASTPHDASKDVQQAVREFDASTAGLRPPTLKYSYKTAEEQPASSGYFTIINVK